MKTLQKISYLFLIFSALTTNTVINLINPSPVNATFPGINGKIAFGSTRDGDNEIYLMNSNGTNVTQLTFNASSDGDPAWSADGTKIVFF